MEPAGVRRDQQVGGGVHAFALQALEQGIRSIAFPAISTGVYAYPKDQAAETAVSVMREFEVRFDRIIACCFSAEDVKLYRSVLGQ
jgi:O-acetyl-ADP-ribose deacetylase (regulator of RNase III)